MASKTQDSYDVLVVGSGASGGWAAKRGAPRGGGDAAPLSTQQVAEMQLTLGRTLEQKGDYERALDAYARGDSDDPFIQGLVQKTGDAKDAISLLRAALHDFDEASIFTIHGFCQRTLHESAFESGSLFDTELEPEQTAGILEEIARDFWRRHFYTAPAELVSYARSKKFGPDFFLDLINKGRAHLDVQIIPEVICPNNINTKSFRERYKNLQETWLAGKAEIGRKLKNPCLKPPGHY